MVINIPFKMPSWNIVARKNHWEYTKIFNELKTITKAYLPLHQGAIKSFPVNIHVHCRWRLSHRRDVDAVLFKPMLDQLVTSKILPDDSTQYVGSVTYTGEIGADSDSIRIEIL